MTKEVLTITSVKSYCHIMIIIILISKIININIINNIKIINIIHIFNINHIVNFINIIIIQINNIIKYY